MGVGLSPRSVLVVISSRPDQRRTSEMTKYIDMDKV